MNTFDAHAFELLIATAIATASFVIALSISRSLVPVVRVAKVVRVVANAPSRVRRR